MTEPKHINEEWTEIIKPQTSLFDLRLKELAEYRDLIVLFVRRNMVAYHKQTVLGPLWHFLQPLVTAILFTFIFGKVAGIKTGEVPPILFNLCSVLFWSFFANCLFGIAHVFINYASMFSKVYFPRLAIPIVITVTSFLQFLIQMALFMGFVLYFIVFEDYDWGITLSGIFLLIPLFFFWSVLTTGLGLIVTSLTAKYRDVSLFIGFGVQLLMYSSAVIFPVANIAESDRTFIYLNPIPAFMESFRYALLGYGEFNIYWLLYSWSFAAVVMFIGILMFKRRELTFIDIV